MTFDDVVQTILTVGEATGHGPAAARVVADLRVRLDRVEAAVSSHPRPRLALLEWTDPPYCPGHWVPDMVELAGATCAFGRAGERSHPVHWDDVAASAPDAVVIAPCGFRLDAAAGLGRDLVKRGVLPRGVPVWAADADAAFVRPGPRLVDGVEALASIAHPEAVAARPDVVKRVG